MITKKAREIIEFVLKQKGKDHLPKYCDMSKSDKVIIVKCGGIEKVCESMGIRKAMKRKKYIKKSDISIYSVIHLEEPKSEVKRKPIY